MVKDANKIDVKLTSKEGEVWERAVTAFEANILAMRVDLELDELRLKHAKKRAKDHEIKCT